MGKKQINLKEDLKELIELSVVNGYIMAKTENMSVNEGDSFNMENEKKVIAKISKVVARLYEEFFK